MSALLGVLTPGSALAQRAPPVKVLDPNMAEAKRLFEDGARAYGTGNYEEAIKLWEKSYQLSGRPLIFDNLANAWEKLGDLHKTRDYLQKWRASAPPEEQPMLDARLRTLDTRIAREDEAARAAAAEKARLVAAQAYTPPPDQRPWLMGAIIAGSGAVVVIAGVVVDAVANGKRPPAADCAMSPSGNLCLGSASSDIALSNRMAIAGDVTWIIGAAAVAAGVTLAVIKRSPTTSAWVVPGPGGLALRGQF